MSLRITKFKCKYQNPTKMNEEELKEKHLEAIENNNFQNRHTLDFSINIQSAAEDCTEISLNYGKQQRLEGMIEVHKEFLGDGFTLKELEQQLKQLKK